MNTAIALSATSSRKCSCSYHRYALEMKAKISPYAAENGDKATNTKFSGILNLICMQGLFRRFKMAYYEQLQFVKDPDVSLKLRKRNVDNLPLFQGNGEFLEGAFISSGGIVSKIILISVIHDISEYYNRNLLKKWGWCLKLSRTWVQ